MVLFSKTYNLGQMAEVATELLQHITHHSVVVFEGELGAGKTTLIKEICGQMGVKEQVSSPTFSLVNSYRLSSQNDEKPILYHIDLYRLSGEAEAVEAGIDELLNSGSICLVEWPSRAKYLIPPDALHVSISHVDSDFRKIEVSQQKID